MPGGESLRTSNPETDLVDTLTYLPPNFVQEVQSVFSSEMFFPVGNDRRLGQAYQKFAEMLPQPDPGRTGVVLLVGSGSFETATQFLPEDTITLHCDRNPRTLFMLRAIRELIRRSDCVGEFIHHADILDDTLNWHAKDEHLLNAAYPINVLKWNHPEISHFLRNDKAFKTAQETLENRQVAYYWLNLGDSTQVHQLGKCIADAGGQVVGANVTNVFEHRYTTRRAPTEFMNAIPFHPDAPIIWSADVNQIGLTAAVHPAKNWLQSLNAPGYL